MKELQCFEEVASELNGVTLTASQKHYRVDR